MDTMHEIRSRPRTRSGRGRRYGRNCGFAVTLGAMVLFVLAACGDDAVTEPEAGPLPGSGEIAAPTPVISLIAPSRAVAGTTETLTLIVRGEGFVARSRIRYAGAERATQFVSATELRTAVTDHDLAQAGDVPVTVHTPGPGGGTAAPTTFEIRPAGGPVPEPAPEIHELSPARITAGWPGPFTLAVKGANFTPATRVTWNGTARETHYINARELRTPVSVSDVALPAEVIIGVDAAAGHTASQHVFPIVLRAPSRIEVTASAGGWLWQGDTMSLTAVARDLAGNAIPHWSFEWSSANGGILEVSAAGLVRGREPGRTEIRATAGSVTGTRTIGVYASPAFDLLFDVGSSDARRIVRWSPGSGLQPRMLTSGISYDPFPSPDGSRIAFTGVVGGNRDIYTIDRNGLGLVRLTTGAATDDEASWSPDGSRIAFRSTRSGAPEVWVMNADGTDQRRLTGPTEGWEVGVESFDPAWSPDSRHIVYAKREGSDTDLWIMAADGGGKRRLTSGQGGDTDPVWSPDGRTVTFRRTVEARALLATVEVGSGQPIHSIEHATDGRAPAISPDGKWTAYTQSATEPLGALMAMPADGTDRPRTVRASAIGGGVNPQWIRRR